MDSTQVENVTAAAPVIEKKRIIKKKIVRVKKEDNITENKEVTVQVDDKSSSTDTEEKDNGSIIPSSRIKNYINKEKLNKDLDD